MNRSILDHADYRVELLMRNDVSTCKPIDTLEMAAHIMWEQACGCVPILDDDGRVIAMLTDRDICMAAYIQGRALATILISTVMSTRLLVATMEESLSDAERRMRCHGLRRLPVVDREKRLVGLLTLSDIAHAGRGTASPGSDGLSAAAIAKTVAGTGHVRS